MSEVWREGVLLVQKKVEGDLVSLIPAVSQLLMKHFLSSPDDTCIPRSSAAITAMAWAPDGSMAVSGNQAGELILWQEAKAVATAQVSRCTLGSLCEFYPGCVLLGIRGCISAWEGNDGATWLIRSTELNLCVHQAPGHIGALIWSSARTFFVLSADEKISEWQVKLRKGSAPGNFR